ncbi:Asp23/Gls24 family envelope stress response protein [Rhodococcus xishaensis]|uniref:Alkaline shock response membrane anchor protein AmaP n=1 Tax=Rhodococcus xishaensis TaxID=2487364 RepID=A0A438AQW6_9NOCA|nr:hypothetical protein [Rhodococcus xishaensis]RVW01090.1 hypothetical protein EGT50_12515 [Rhodococcus xishaensis]
MKRGTAALNRILVLAVGLLLAAAGGVALAWDRDVQAVHDAAAHIDPDWVTAIPDQRWWNWALGATIAACFVLGTVVLLVDLVRRRAAPSTLHETTTGTAVAIDLGPIATGVAAELGRLPGVRQARGRAFSDRGLATIQVTLDADPHSDTDSLIRTSEEVAAATTSALGGPGVTDVAVRVLLHLDRADHPPAPEPERPSAAPGGADRPST